MVLSWDFEISTLKQESNNMAVEKERNKAKIFWNIMSSSYHME